MIRLIKNWMLPIAMLTGSIFYSLFGALSFLTPVLIFTMLLLTFSKLSPKTLRFTPLHCWLLAIQILGSLAVYLALAPFNPIVAQGVMICLLAPTATAAAVITGMLGGDISFVTSFVFASNLGVAVVAPVLFSYVGTTNDMPFIHSFLYICKEVIPLLMAPLLVAWTIRFWFPRLQEKITSLSGLSFYIWALALAIVTGKTVKFLVEQDHPNYDTEIWVGVGSLVICVLQFYVGKKIGARYGNRIAAGQSLAQKNTILAIWMSHIYLNPIASIGPASYVLWQNTINSYQLWKKRKVS